MHAPLFLIFQATEKSLPELIYAVYITSSVTGSLRSNRTITGEDLPAWQAIYAAIYSLCPRGSVYKLDATSQDDD
jgi:hypothetical protein